MIYDKVGDFENGRAAVFVNNLGWGFVNQDGTVIIPVRYEAVGKYENGIVPVSQNGKWGLLNEYGALVTLLKYDEIGNSSEGMARVRINRRLGVVNHRGQELLPPNYETIKPVENRIQVESADKIGYIDIEGNWIWQPSK